MVAKCRDQFWTGIVVDLYDTDASRGWKGGFAIWAADDGNLVVICLEKGAQNG